jgi:quercetin dioxygenase-like cupin family protein
MNVEKIVWKDGELAIDAVGEMNSLGNAKLQWGVATFPPGQRHPAEGMSQHAGIEISLILEGAFSIETESGTRRIGADSIVTIPAGQAHATTALVNSRVFYLLLESEVK